MTYDKNGNLKTKVDTGGRTTSYDYDTANRLTKITDALSNETQFTYNARSQMTKVKDALNQEYNFTYDAHGRVLTQNRNSQTMTFTYDAVGNRATREDYNGDDTTYTYDDLNRLTNIAYTGASGENASYTYDDLSRLLTAVNAAGTVTFTYDNRGRLATEEDVFGHDLEYTYDAAGRRTGLELDSTPHTSYTYDNANRLTTLTDEASNDFTFAYDNANRLTSRVMPNGITSTYTYDNMSRLKRLKHENTSTTLYDDQFTYNAANQIGQIAGLAATKNYTYDNINRLTGMTDGTNTESYTYDAVGNRTASHLSSSYTTGSFNRVTATDSATYTYNSNGSTTGKAVGSINWTYGWDRENKMISAGDGTNSASYQYDALGRRIKRTQGSDVQKFTHDGQDVVLDDINSTLTKYQNGPGIDNKLKYATGGTSKYFLQSHLGSTVTITNSSGTSVDSNSYDSFGNATNASFSSRYQYTGREADPLTGLSFYRARWHDSGLGRFLSEDPIGFVGGNINLYGYVNNNPSSSVDPSGLFPSMWRWQMHQAITRNALAGLATDAQIAAMNAANQSFDARKQDSIFAPYHAMTRYGQRNTQDARAEANDFIRERICAARGYMSRGLELSAMEAMGQAMHTMQDFESPAHTGFQEAWPNTSFFTALHFGHYLKETFFPGAENIIRAENNTRRAWAYFQGAPMPMDFFSGSGPTNGCDCGK